MPKDNAEKKLLKLINTKEAKALSAQKSAPKSSGFKFVFQIKTLNMILSVLIVLFVILIAFEIFAGMKSFKTPITITAQTHVPSVGDSNPLKPSMDKVTAYMKKLASRNIFAPVEKEPLPEGVSVTADNENLARMVSKFKIRGVSWMDFADTASIMVENTETGDVYFLREGEKIDNIITIQTIYADRAVLSYEDEEIMLKL